MANLDDMNKSLDDIIMKLEHILDLQAMAIENNVELQTRVAEQRNAPVHAEQNLAVLECPFCHSKISTFRNDVNCTCGALAIYDDYYGAGFVWRWTPPETPNSNRSAGG